MSIILNIQCNGCGSTLNLNYGDSVSYMLDKHHWKKSADGHHYCNGCVAHDYTMCGACGNIVKKSDIHDFEGDNVILCGDCFDDYFDNAQEGGAA